MSKISIIVPVYKVEKYIGQCIESILSQTFKDFELILIDDGSPDNSGAICDEYAKRDDRIKVFHKENGGVSSARNYGIRKAKGDYLCFVDSDDTIDVSYLEDYGSLDEAYDIYFQGYRKVNGLTEVESHGFTSECSSDMSEIIAFAERHNIINSPCFKLYKRSIINRNNIEFDTNTSFGEDHLFSLNYLLFAETATFSVSKGYVYRVSEQESLTRRTLPLDEVNYYTLKVREIHDMLEKRFSNPMLTESFQWRYLDNIVRAVRTSISKAYNSNDYCRTVDLYKSSFRSLPTDIFSTRTRIMFFIIFHLPEKLSYNVLRKII